MPDTLTRQAERLYQVFSAMVRAYQFRDRDGICCHGISVSQCYALDVLAARGPRTMGELAGDLYLEISSMTRAVDALVADGLAARVEDGRDRRVRRVRITPRGRALLKKIQADLLREYEGVLEGIAPESRAAVIQAAGALLEAFQERQRRRTVEANSACRVATCGSDLPPVQAGVPRAVGQPASRRKAKPKSDRVRSRT